MSKKAAAGRQGKAEQAVTGDAIVRAARRYVGVPFRHAGRNLYGLDCVGLLIRLLWDFGISDYDCVDYPPQSVNTEFLKAQLLQFCEPIAKEDAQPGDILLFSIIGSPQHVGIDCGTDAAGERWFVHAYQSAGKVIESRFDSAWQKRLCGAFRYRFRTT